MQRSIPRYLGCRRSVSQRCFQTFNPESLNRRELLLTSNRVHLTETTICCFPAFCKATHHVCRMLLTEDTAGPDPRASTTIELEQNPSFCSFLCHFCGL